MRMKEGVQRYVSIMKKLFLIFSFIAIPAFMTCLVFAFSGFSVFIYISPAVGVLYLAVYGFYAMFVSMGTVIGMEITDKMIHIKTKRKTFSYDVHAGCVDMKVTDRKFVGTFETQTSRDKFTFYRRVLFSRYSDEQFTVDEIRLFFPRIDEMLN